MRRPVPRAALSIAGSDSGGGAGLQADVRTFAGYGLLGCTVVTAVTAQNTAEVRRIESMSPDLVLAQLDAVLCDLPVRAIKTGMLASADIVRVVAERLAVIEPAVPLVVDPVGASSTGTLLNDDDTMTQLRDTLLPIATLVTPNLPEAMVLLGRRDVGSVEEVATALFERLGGACAVLVTGGHVDDLSRCVDVLQLRDGRTFRFEAPRIETASTHGTGCVLSAAVTANLALGHSLPDAVRDAKSRVTQALRHAVPMGRGSGPVDTTGSTSAGGTHA